LLAVNPDPRESDLLPLPQEFVGRWQSGLNTLATRTPDGGQKQEGGDMKMTVDLAPCLLLLLAAIAVTEPLIANTGRNVARFRSQARGAARA